MAGQVGRHVVSVLEQAAERHLAGGSPDQYELFLMQVGAAGTFNDYDASELYWQRVQTVLDTFFTSAQRAEICARLIEGGAPRTAPEFEGFLARALAERRLQEVVTALHGRRSATAR